MTYKTYGIIIKRFNLGEADRIITIFTENKGKIRAIAKGIRKIKSKLSGNVELFCLSNFVIAEGKRIDIITSALIEKCYFNLRNNLSSTQKAQYFGELIEKLTEENDSHPEIYRLLDDVLENLNTDISTILIPYFEWNLISFIGYHPEMEKCFSCRRKILENENIYFNFNHGGIVCEDCSKNDLKISIPAVKLLRLFLHHKISSLRKIKIEKNTLMEVQRVTKNYLSVKSEKEFLSQKFLK